MKSSPGWCVCSWVAQLCSKRKWTMAAAWKSLASFLMSTRKACGVNRAPKRLLLPVRFVQHRAALHAGCKMVCHHGGCAGCWSAQSRGCIQACRQAPLHCSVCLAKCVSPRSAQLGLAAHFPQTRQRNVAATVCPGQGSLLQSGTVTQPCTSLVEPNSQTQLTAMLGMEQASEELDSHLCRCSRGAPKDCCRHLGGWKNLFLRPRASS